jgi:hypothetical protein
MIFNEHVNEYEGILIKANPSNLEFVENKANFLGNILSETPYEGHVNVLVSVKDYLGDKLLEPLKRLDIPYYRVKSDKNPQYII